MTEPGDELDARIRSLEAERLRPVPGTPPKNRPEITEMDDVGDFKRRLDAFERRLKAFGKRYHPDEINQEGGAE